MFWCVYGPLAIPKAAKEVSDKVKRETEELTEQLGLERGALWALEVAVSGVIDTLESIEPIGDILKDIISVLSNSLPRHLKLLTAEGNRSEVLQERYLEQPAIGTSEARDLVALSVFGRTQDDLEKYLDQQFDSAQQMDSFLAQKVVSWIETELSLRSDPKRDVRKDDHAGDNRNSNNQKYDGATKQHSDANSRHEERMDISPLMQYSKDLLSAHRKYEEQHGSAKTLSDIQNMQLIECNYAIPFKLFTFSVRDVIDFLEPCACGIIILTVLVSAVGFFVPGYVVLSC